MLNTDINLLLLKIYEGNDLASFKKKYFYDDERLAQLVSPFVRKAEAAQRIVAVVFVKTAYVACCHCRLLKKALT